MIRIKWKDYFSIFVFFALFAWILYISEIKWFIDIFTLIFTILVLSFLLWGLYYLVKRIFKSKNISSFGAFTSTFVFIVSIFIFIVSITLWSFVYYYNEKSPALMPEYHLTNWDKKLVFQWMVHIWSENFYERVSKNLKKYKEEWFIHFFEWVKPGKPESQQEFNKIMWVKFDAGLYENMSKLFWVTFQDYNKIINPFSQTKDINIDISMDEIIEEYKKIKKTDNNPKHVVDYKVIWDFLNKLNEKELKFTVYLSRSFLNMMIWNKEFLQQLTEAWNKEIFEVILWSRNKVLVDAIVNSNEKNIYVTYGLLHFDWVYKLLQEKDPNWKIEKIVKYRAIN